MKDLNIEIRLRNNRLLARRKELGMTQRDFAKAAGISLDTYAGLERMTRPPLRTCDDRGPLETPQWSPGAVALADFYNCDPGELFPQFAISGRPPVLRVERDEDELGLLVGQASQEMLCSPEDAVARRDLRDTITELLDELDPRERYVIERRFGLDGREPQSLDEIKGGVKNRGPKKIRTWDDDTKEWKHVRVDRSAGVTREAARQIELLAIRKLQHCTRSDRLRDFVEG